MDSIERQRLRNWIVVGGLSAVISAGVVVYPYLLQGVVFRFGVNRVAFALLFFAAISFALPGRRLGRALRSGAAPSVGIPVLLVAAVATEQSVYLRLVPCIVYLMLADFFRTSLRAGDSIIERAARYLVPEAPEFIRSYCRKVTRLWAAFFLGSGLIIAALAVSGEFAWWELFTGRLVYTLMLAASIIEFLVRKTWFRYYFYRGPIDRLWERWFPPENTAAGRRSMQHIASVRRMRRSNGD